MKLVPGWVSSLFRGHKGARSREILPDPSQVGLPAQGKAALYEAIAERIRSADKCAIHIKYAQSASASVGANISKSFGGMQGSGEQISEEIYHFEGFKSAETKV